MQRRAASTAGHAASCFQGTFTRTVGSSLITFCSDDSHPAPVAVSPGPHSPRVVPQVGSPGGEPLSSCGPRGDAPWPGLDPQRWRKSGPSWSWAACQVQSTFSVSYVSPVTVSRVVQAVGHGFVIFRHFSAAPSGVGWVQVGAGDPWAGWPGEGCGEWEFRGSPGTDLPMSPWLFSCVGVTSMPSLSQCYHLTLVLQGHQPGSSRPGPRVLTFPSARSRTKPDHDRGVPRHCCPEPPSPAFGLAQGPGPGPITWPGLSSAPPGCHLPSQGWDQQQPLTVGCVRTRISAHLVGSARSRTFPWCGHPARVVGTSMPLL